MKAFLTSLLMVCSMTLLANPITYQKLYEVNKLWVEQNDITILPGVNCKDSKDLIRLHLSLVELTLRARNVAHLTPEQKSKRVQSLNDLHEYWLAGNFPVNDITNYRTPIFIDNHDNFCAVGYLVKASGQEDVSRMIAANTNLAYVRQMNYEELNNWAVEYGFTKDELAWIQPGYDPNCYAKKVGQGTDGEVMELYADEADGKLYVGGSFTKVDDNVTANNIAYVTQQGDNYTWHNMGAGVNGTVKAITKFNNKIYIGGSFTIADGNPVTNVAYWDGTAWQAAGCTYGTVNDLLVYSNELFACGAFDVCAALSEVNFAKWNGTVWQAQGSLTGPVNTMEPWNGGIMLGGDMQYMGNSERILKWDPNSGIQTFSNNVDNIVNDFEIFNDDLYAATKGSTNDDKMLQHLNGNTWTEENNPMPFIGNELSFNTLCVDGNTFMAGGSFASAGLIMYPMHNCINLLNTGDFNEWISVDNDINKIVVFRGRVYAGGKFINTDLNGIAYKAYLYPKDIDDMKKPKAISVFPNPAADKLQIKGLDEPTSYNVLNVTGQSILKGETSSDINLHGLPHGTYQLQLQNSSTVSNHTFIKE